MKKFSALLTMATVVLALPKTCRADEVTDWNRNMLHAALVAKTSPMVTSRVGAMVQTAVFDAVNGIHPHYEPIRVIASAPHGASQRAAAIQAAYGILVRLFPTQKPDFDAELAASSAALADPDQDGDQDADEESILRGLDWGQTVADAIWAWRSTDGFSSPPPPFMGGNAVGEWRPTPPAFAAGAVPQFATMTPWAILAHDQFRPGGPPVLTSDQWAADFNETKSMGSIVSTARTADGTLLSQFWNASTVTYYWNSVALSLLADKHTQRVDKARLLALLNISIADAVIACWDAKYHYVAWRPVTAIPLGDTDGNLATAGDPTWMPLLTTPAHPEYPSGHSTTSSAAATVLAHFFGEQTAFAVNSDVMLGVTRSFSSFSDAQDEIANARIFGGIHFRSACRDGRATGHSVAEYVLQHAAQRSHGQGPDRDEAGD